MERGLNKVLSVKDLKVIYTSEGKIVRAVNGVSFDLESGKTLGLVGETGAGKTSIAKALMRILPQPPARVEGGQIFVNGQDILKISEAEMRKLRGRKLSMIFQDPMTALNPLMTVVDQIAEGIKIHYDVSRAESIQKAIEILEMVGITADRATEYPHQFSGGMKQRVVIAMALACNPEILIADEPTTALDVTIQAQVMEMIGKLIKERNTAMILITHDLGVVAEVCDYIAVVYAGQIVEYGSKEAVYDHPAHPYTKGLFAALPDLSKKVRRLSPIEGLPPDPTNLPEGCSFHPRCPYASEECGCKSVEMKQVGPEHMARCCKISGEEGK